MRTLEDALNYFAYHPATPGPDGTGVRHAAVRDLFTEFLTRLWPLIPDGPDKTVTVRTLWETQTLANLAIALTAPADTSATRLVARVLPPVEQWVGWSVTDATTREAVRQGVEYMRQRYGVLTPEQASGFWDAWESRMKTALDNAQMTRREVEAEEGLNVDPDDKDCGS
jgi:hypothetical protein